MCTYVCIYICIYHLQYIISFSSLGQTLTKLKHGKTFPIQLRSWEKIGYILFLDFLLIL